MAKRLKLLSGAYKSILTTVVPEDIKQKLNLPDGATWADATAHQVTRAAVGLIKEDTLSFRAITELRETTEGKTPEKAIVADSNSELANLAKIMQGEPAAPDEDEEEGEDQSTDPEQEFHNDPPPETE